MTNPSALLDRTAGALAGPSPTQIGLGLERLRLRLHRRVLWQRSLWQRAVVTPAQGMAITHEEVDLACLGADVPDAEAEFFRVDETAHRLSEVISSVEEAMRDVAGTMDQLRELFALSPAEEELLWLCMGPVIDPNLARVYGYLHDDVRRCGATVWLARAVFLRNADAAVQPLNALTKWCLAAPRSGDEEQWGPFARWDADPRIVDFLLGRSGVAPALHPHARWVALPGGPAYEPRAAAKLRDVAERAQSSGRGVAQVIGPVGVGRRTWAVRVCQACGWRLLELDSPSLLAGPDARQQAVRAEREALLQGCALLWDRADQVNPDLWRALSWRPVLQFFIGEKPAALPASAPYVETIYFALPSPGERRALWTSALPRWWASGEAEVLAERFTLTPAEIQRVSTAAASGREALWEACRALSRVGLHGLATLLPCPFAWDDLVLPPDTTAHLREIAAHAVHRARVYDEWGFGAKRPLGRGLTALFSGASGTGKTMAAQVLTTELGVALFRVDLAGVVSKYIGETEKNLRQVFDEAERLNAVILFDEADALFGRRTEVRDAHDRYANIEINYLLQRMEAYEGLAILATNRKSDLDTAFVRRLRFIIDFPLPGIAEREAIWRRALPERGPQQLPLLGDVDWPYLAAHLEVTGAAIKNIALAAAFLACEERSRIEMRHVLRAARRELAKAGRVVGRGELAEHSRE